MAGSWTSDRFPQFEQAIRRLTEQHRELVDEPLRLALSYMPGAGRDQQHIYLFEVIDAPWQRIRPEGDLFEVVFGSSDGFPMKANEQLHLILTNPPELRIALKERWGLAIEVVNAIRFRDYEVLFKDDVGQEALALLQAGAGRLEPARG
jgi:hypothetical protein